MDRLGRGYLAHHCSAQSFRVVYRSRCRPHGDPSYASLLERHEFWRTAGVGLLLHALPLRGAWLDHPRHGHCRFRTAVENPIELLVHTWRLGRARIGRGRLWLVLGGGVLLSDAGHGSGGGRAVDLDGLLGQHAEGDRDLLLLAVHIHREQGQVVGVVWIR